MLNDNLPITQEIVEEIQNIKEKNNVESKDAN